MVQARVGVKKIWQNKGKGRESCVKSSGEELGMLEGKGSVIAHVICLLECNKTNHACLPDSQKGNQAKSREGWW